MHAPPLWVAIAGWLTAFVVVIVGYLIHTPTTIVFSSAKAGRELGYRPGPVEPALARAVTEALALRNSDG